MFAVSSSPQKSKHRPYYGRCFLFQNTLNVYIHKCAGKECSNCVAIGVWIFELSPLESADRREAISLSPQHSNIVSLHHNNTTNDLLIHKIVYYSQKPIISSINYERAIQIYFLFPANTHHILNLFQ